jgi:hypothetical protein
LGLRFLHQFANAIMQPVARDDRAHIDYILSQVATEYFREHLFDAGRLDGVRFPSTVDPRGNNVVIFVDKVVAEPETTWGPNQSPPLDFIGWKRVNAKARAAR